MINKLDIVLAVAQQQLNLNGQTTTLDVKKECHRLYPNVILNQADVSYYMNHIYNQNMIQGINYSDNGIYREYYITKQTPINVNIGQINSQSLSNDGQSLTSSVFTNHPNNISRNDLVQKMRDLNPGEVFAVTFKKADGTVRTHIGIRQNQFMNNNGYITIRIYDGTLRSVNPKTVMNVLIDSELFIAK